MARKPHDLYCAGLIFALALCGAGASLMPGRAFGPYDLLRHQYPWGIASPAASRPANPEPQDFVHQFHPWREHYARTLRSGEVPLWNPHQMCGMPFAANDQSAVFYPPNLIFIAMPVARAFGFSAVLHLFIAGLSMFLFARLLGAGRPGALVSGAAFMFTGWMTVWMPHASKVDAAAWAPLAFLFVELSLSRRNLKWAIPASIALGMQFTAGFLQIAAYTAYALFIYSAARWFFSRGDKDGVLPSGALLAPALSCAGGVAIAAVHQFQVASVVAITQRPASPASNLVFFPQGIPLPMMLTALLPDFFGNPSIPGFARQLNYTETCCYAGAGALCLALAALLGANLAPRRRAAVMSLGVVAAAGLFSAPGTPLYAPFYYLVPGAKFLAANRVIFLFMFGVAALSGLGAALVIEGRGRGPAVRAAVYIFMAAALGAVAVAKHAGGTPPAPQAILIRSAALFATAVILAAAAAFLPARRALRAAFLLAAVAGDLFIWGHNFTPITDTADAFPVTESIAALKNATSLDAMRVHTYSFDPARGRSVGNILFPNTATAYGLDDIRGYDSLYLKRYQDFMAAVQESGSQMKMGRYTVVNTNVVRSKWIDFMSVRYLYAAALPPADSGYVPAFNPPHDLPVFINPAAMPRANVLSSWIISGGDRALDVMMRPDFSPRENAVLEAEPPGLGRIAKPQPARPARVASRTAGTLRISAEGQGLLVVSDTWAPGWTAMVDGKPAPMLRADYTFRAVPLTTPGKHDILMEYTPAPAAAGLALSLLSLAAAAAGLAVFRKDLRDAKQQQ